MVELNSLKRPKGVDKDGKRVGRGPGSGRGKTSGRGHKGRKARSGGNTRPGFEGGQMPLQRRVPKRGFNPWRAVEPQVVNVGDLGRIEGDEATLEAMRAAGLVRSRKRPVKVLGDGELDRALRVHAHGFSRGARAKIEAAGGTAVEIEDAAAESDLDRDGDAGSGSD